MTSLRQQKNHSRKQPNKPVANSAVPYPSIITQVNKEDEKSSQFFDIKNIFKCCNMLWKCLPFKKQSFAQIEEAAVQGLLEPQLPHFHGKKTIVLDLDETLVHSTFEPVKNPDLVLPVVIKGTTYRINVMIRPGTEEFLARMGELFEVVVFTASLAEYAEPLVKVLDTTNAVSYLLYRQHCTPVNGIYVKDLTLLGRDMKNIILVDNSPNSFLFQPENAYHIKNFFDDKTDRELDRLTYFLENITKVKDVRPVEDHRARIEPHQHLHQAHVKVVKVNHDSVPDQEPDQEQQEIEQDESSMVGLDDISIIQDNNPSKQNMKRREEKNSNVETEPDLRRDDREGEFPEVVVSERNKNKAGLYAQYYAKAAKAVPLTERIVVNDRLIPQALDSSVDLELPSPKESDALINHREADAFFENNSSSSSSKESKNNKSANKPKIPAFPKTKAGVFAGNNFVAVNDPALEGHQVEDVRFLTGVENLNSPLGKQIKIDLTNKMENAC